MTTAEYLRTIGGAEWIRRCLEAGNDAPLMLVLDHATQAAAAERSRTLCILADRATYLAAIGCGMAAKKLREVAAKIQKGE